MGLFRRNPNEKAYTGGKKHWTDVIKDTGPENLLLWKQPEEDFNTNSTLIVMPGEMAVFVNNGNIEAVFREGRYVLATQNYPFISRLKNVLTGGISTFNCVVYFVRAAHSSEIRWGTDTPVPVRDPYYGIQTKIQARGSYRVSLQEPALFLKKLVGSRRPLTTEDDLNDYFASEFQQHIRSAIADYVRTSGQDVLTICAEQNSIAKGVGEELAPALEKYGLRLENFSVAAINIPDDDPNRMRLEEASAKKLERDIQGYTWEQEQQYRMMNRFAGAQSLAGDAARLGAGLGAGAAMVQQTAGMTERLMNSTRQQTAPQAAPQQNAWQAAPQMDSSPAAPQQAQAVSAQASAPADPAATLRQLKQLLEEGLIPQEVYDQKMQEILKRM